MSRDALVVGINTYERLKSLEAPSRDAEAMAQLLEKYGEFKVTRLPAVKDKLNNTTRVGQKTKVTLTQLEEAIIQLFKPEGKHIPDTALLYFSGHGLRKNKGIQEGFLATNDVNPEVGNWGVRLKWLRELLQESPVRQQIIWLDCCHSGELLNFDQADPGERGKGRDLCFIAASREFEVAYEEINSTHSVLTTALLKGLEPKQEQWVSNYTLVDFLNQERHTFPQRPIFTNCGAPIDLTRRWNAPVKETTVVSKQAICPYKGLTYFDCNEEDPKYFYGRTALTDQLLEKVRQGNFLAVLGASGSGKSSVIRAGLIHQLKLGQRISGSDEWRICILRPSEHPFQRLVEALPEPGLSEADRAIELTKIQQLMGAGATEGLGNLISAAQTSRVVLLVDQFEETFTLCKNPTEQLRFFECLLGALERANNKLCLVIAMRADFFGKCAEQEYAGLASKIQEHLVTVTPMNQEDLEQAITEPAKKVGLEVEQELVDQMIADVDGSPGSLPLLQYTLTELWRQRTEERLTLSAYTRLGGVKRTLQKRADEVYESLATEEQQTAKRIFLELTQLGEGTEDTRRQVLQWDLVNPQQSAELVDRVIQKLADAKLVVTSTLIEKGSKSGQAAVVDVAHEALIRYWSRLRQWLNENREAIRIERRIEAAVQEWESQGKPEETAYLLQGGKLSEAQSYLDNYSHLGLLSSLAQDYIQVSKVASDRLRQEEEERRQLELEAAQKLAEESEARRQAEEKRRKAAQARIWVTRVSTLLVSTAAIFSFVQWRLAQKQSNLLQFQVLNDYATESSESSKALAPDSKPDALVGSLIAYLEAGKQLKKIEQLDITDPVIAFPNWMRDRTDAFKQEGRAHKAELDIPNPSENGDTKIEFLANLRQIVYRTKEHNTAVNGISSSSDNQSLITTLKGHKNNVNHVSFSRDGKTIISASDDGTVKLWGRDGTLKTSIKDNAPIAGASLSQDGQFIATASGNNVNLWRLDGTLIKTLKGHTDGVLDVSFSPDGQMIASASNDKTVKLWNRNGTLINTLEGHTDPVIRVSFSPDNQMIASASNDKTVKLWKRDGTLIDTFEGHTDGVLDVSFSPDNKMIASASLDNTVRLWRLDGTLISILKGHTFRVIKVSFSPDGDGDRKTIATASKDRTIKLWQTKNLDNLDYLLGQGCNELREYLKSPNNLISKQERSRPVCDDI